MIDDTFGPMSGDPLDDPPSSRTPPPKRAIAKENFARIYYGRARKLFPRIGGPAWMLLVELDRLTLGGKGHNPVELTPRALKGSGLTRWQIERGLRLLEKAGVVTVERKRGRSPLVTFLWYPLKS
jgi:hypothetical protein